MSREAMNLSQLTMTSNKKESKALMRVEVVLGKKVGENASAVDHLGIGDSDEKTCSFLSC